MIVKRNIPGFSLGPDSDCAKAVQRNELFGRYTNNSLIFYLAAITRRTAGSVTGRTVLFTFRTRLGSGATASSVRFAFRFTAAIATGIITVTAGTAIVARAVICSARSATIAA